MNKTCKTSKELGEALNNNEAYIEIEGDLANKVMRIKATGKAVWGVCAVALGAAITLGIVAVATTPVPPLGGASLGFAGVAAVPVVTVLGPAAATAVAIGVAAGGIGALNTLRDKYKIIKKEERHIILQRK